MLSIVIPTHQRTDLLRPCLQAATTHAPAGSEIIVVDDASPNAAASTLAASFPNVRAVRLPRQSGFARAANAGIRASRGDIVEMLNDDTEVQPGWAVAALRWFGDPAIGAVAPLVLAWPAGRIMRFEDEAVRKDIELHVEEKNFCHLGRNHCRFRVVSFLWEQDFLPAKPLRMENPWVEGTNQHHGNFFGIRCA